MPFVDEGAPQPHDLTNYVPTAEQIQRQNEYSHRNQQSDMIWLAIVGVVAIGFLWFLFNRRRRIVRVMSEKAITVAAYGLRAKKKVGSTATELKSAIEDRERSL